MLLKLDNTDNRLALEALPALPFVSELGHAKFMCDGLSVSDAAVMDGDGYSDYVKPFRTEEDLHILAALCGQRASIAIALDQKRLAEQLFAIGRSIVGMQEETRSAASTHLLLAGVKQQLLSVFDQQDDLLKEAMPDYAKLWQRDKALLSLAQGAQAKRTQLAWDHFLALD